MKLGERKGKEKGMSRKERGEKLYPKRGRGEKSKTLAHKN